MLSGSGVSDSAIPWTEPARVFCPWGVSRQEYCTGLPWPSGGSSQPRDRRSRTLQVDSLPFDRYGYYYLKSQEYHTELTHTNIC